MFQHILWKGLSFLIKGSSKARGSPGCEGQLDAVARYAAEAPVSEGIATACKFPGGNDKRCAGITISSSSAYRMML